jgi:hypothetical protein
MPDVIELDETMDAFSVPSPTWVETATSEDNAEFCRCLVRFLLDFMSVGAPVSPHSTGKTLPWGERAGGAGGAARRPARRQSTRPVAVVALPTAAGSFRVPPFVAGDRVQPS